MRSRKWFCLSMAWALFAATAARGQDSGGPDQVNDGAQRPPAPSSNVSYEEFSSVLARLEALEAQQKAKEGEKKAEAAPDEGCPWFCCDGKKAKEVPLKGLTYKVGGRIFWDNYWFDQSPGSKAIVGDEQNSTGFRAARISVAGQVWENVEYEIELDLAAFNTPADAILADDQETKFKNVYMQVDEIPVIHTVRIGHFKEPFSLERLTNINDITFMERSLADGALVPARNMGVQIGGDLGDYKDASWWTGVFRSEDNEDPPGISRDTSDWVMTTRVCWLPYYDECSEGRYLWHVGGGFTYRNYGDGTIRFHTRPELGGGTTPDPGDWLDVTLSAFNDYVWNAETAVVWGSLSVQAEYFQAHTNTTVGADKVYDGWYVEASYFLTGEHRGYRREAKAFNRIKVHENAWWVDTPGGWCFGRGAWELAARYDRLNLQDGNNVGVVAGQQGRMQNFTCGVNWYLNPYCRMMFNYIHSHLERIDGREGDANLFGTRCQVDW
jgi:phosphate-selective porin OprO and OprP